MQSYFRCAALGIALLAGSTQAVAQCVIKPIMTEEDLAKCRDADDTEARINASPELQHCGQLISKYGRPLLEAIVDKRGNQITANVKGQIKQVFGVPRPEFITAETVCTDMRLLGTTPAAFERAFVARRDQLERDRQERAAQLERIRLQQEAELARRRAEQEVERREAAKLKKQQMEFAAKEMAQKLAVYQAVPEAQRIAEAQAKIKYILKDPDSAQFRNVRARDGAVCGEFNAKNSFGGYNGFTGFVVAFDSMAVDSKDSSYEYRILARTHC